MSWIDQRSAEEVAAQIRSVFGPRCRPDGDWDRGWAAAVQSIAEFIESDGSE